MVKKLIFLLLTFFRSETDFKDDIQNYINLVGTAQSAKRRSASGSSTAGPSSLKNKKAVEKPTRPKIDMEVIKAKLQSNCKSQHNNRDPTDLPETHSASVRAMKESLVQQFFGGANNVRNNFWPSQYLSKSFTFATTINLVYDLIYFYSLISWY